MDLQFLFPNGDFIPLFQPLVGIAGCTIAKSEHGCLLLHTLQQEGILAMRSEYRYAQDLSQLISATGMVEMAVGQQDLGRFKLEGIELIHDLSGVATRVYDRCFSGFVAPEQGAVLLEWGDRNDFVMH
jgi:hypothetical protein